MSVVFIKGKVKEVDINKARKDYNQYIKVVVDIKKKLIAIGGKWHVDSEKILLENGAVQDNIWGGGIDLNTKNIETVALINFRPRLGNNSQEILDEKKRSEFINIVRNKFNL